MNLNACLGTWKRFLADNYNPAALRLLLGSDSKTDIREAVHWEQKHRE